MDLQEYQAKEILKKYGIAMPEFAVASSLADVEQILKQKGWQQVVLKGQILAGGRGKAGAIKLATNRKEACQAAKELIGKKIFNEQTGPEGLIINRLLLTPRIEIEHEYYLSLILDRKQAACAMIASPSGGMEIEKLAKQPEAILSLPLLDEQFRGYQLLRLKKFMNWSDSLFAQAVPLIKGMVNAFHETDATLLEINPLVKTADDQLLALDAKLSIDDNALFRQPLLKAFFDPSEGNPIEARAKAHELTYIALHGNVGCMVNGAGLAMSTMDLIQHYGGQPANFLDVGGSATKEQISEGFKIILSDPKVKSMLINIFGGIMDCATIAKGIIDAASGLKNLVPLVVRLEGTNVELGRKVLEESNLNLLFANNLSKAAELAVRMAS